MEQQPAPIPKEYQGPIEVKPEAHTPTEVAIEHMYGQKEIVFQETGTIFKSSDQQT